jgi:hypothetical protein
MEETNTIKQELKYVFQITKMITFEVEYYTLGSNSKPYFTTSSNEFIRSKRDYSRCGQCQRDILPKGGLARKFYEKWDKFHLEDLTDSQYNELIEDIEELKSKYNYLSKIRDTFANTNIDFYFEDIVNLSKLTPKGKVK